MKYLLAAPSPAYRLDGGRFALESAFVQHLRELKQLLGPAFDELVLVMPAMSQDRYLSTSAALSVVEEGLEGIRLVNLYRAGCSKGEFLRAVPRIVRELRRWIARCDVLHVDYSYDLFRPVGAIACLMGRLQGKRVMAIDDIDRRRDAQMRWRMGQWPTKTYLACRYVYDPIRFLLYHAYVKMADLMLFKELGQVRDFGRGADHVRLILDPNFSAEQIVTDAKVEAKIHALSDPDRPLKLMYFGRLVAYKGVDRMIDAVASAHRAGASITFEIMGAGEERDALVEQAQCLGIQHLITWIPPVPYGDAFFEVLRERDVLLAAPITGDTPRSAWDALASGMPLVAFDTDFYRSIAEYSGAVELTPWPDPEAMAQRLVTMARDKTALIPLVRRAVETARANTSEVWMRKRNDWVMELCADLPGAQPVSGLSSCAGVPGTRGRAQNEAGGTTPA